MSSGSSSAVTLTLVEFLTAQLDDEAARADRCDCAIRSTVTEEHLRDHLNTKHRRAFILADIAAKRKIIEQAQDAESFFRAETDPASHDYRDDGPRYAEDVWQAWEAVLKLLAVPFANRPGYDEAWRP